MKADGLALKRKASTSFFAGFSRFTTKVARKEDDQY